MAGDDDFDVDVDVYAEGSNDQEQDGHREDAHEYHEEGRDDGVEELDDDQRQNEQDNPSHEATEGNGADATTAQHGLKRKSEEDDRPVDPNATSALMISELNWWVTDDDVRGWLKKAHSEGEVKDMTFSEHKVNGKSKGLVGCAHLL